MLRAVDGAVGPALRAAELVEGEFGALHALTEGRDVLDVVLALGFEFADARPGLFSRSRWASSNWSART